MQFRFAHFADVHLGYQQYGLTERFRDFGQAWSSAVETALQAKVDFVLIAGDLFEKRNTDPLAFEQAQCELLRFKEAGIPVIAIEGNHDRYIHNREHSWVKVLASQHLLSLLDAVEPDGNVAYQPYNPDTQMGGYIDLPQGVRVLGIRYRGERLVRDVEALKSMLATEGTGDAKYVIFMCHTGVQKETEFPTGRDYIHLYRLDALRPPVDYIAIGHIHYAKREGDWLFQPGSLENCSSEEAHPDRPHGWYLVEVDTDAEPKHTISLQQPPKRPFVLLRFAMDGFTSQSELQSAFGQWLQEQYSTPFETSPLIEISLEGMLQIPRHQLDLAALEELARETFQPLHLRLRSRWELPGEQLPLESTQTREELELQVLTDAFLQDAFAQDAAGLFAKWSVHLKQYALKNTPPEEFLTLLDQAIALQKGDTP